MGVAPSYTTSGDTIGARLGEIRDLHWDWFNPPRLILPDSKTGAKVIWLNSQALAIIDAEPRIERCRYVFPDRRRTAPLSLDAWWPKFRRKCALPNVRIHDLRHIFASHAAMNKETLPMIGRLLGHANHQSTARYAHLDDDHILDAAQQIGDAIERMMA